MKNEKEKYLLAKMEGCYLFLLALNEVPPELLKEIVKLKKDPEAKIPPKVAQKIAKFWHAFYPKGLEEMKRAVEKEVDLLEREEIDLGEEIDVTELLDDFALTRRKNETIH